MLGGVQGKWNSISILATHYGPRPVSYYKNVNIKNSAHVAQIRSKPKYLKAK
jgi:hypothetical protein